MPSIGFMLVVMCCRIIFKLAVLGLKSNAPGQAHPRVDLVGIVGRHNLSLVHARTPSVVKLDGKAMNRIPALEKRQAGPHGNPACSGHI
jgi:hypothetical protein